MGWLSAVKGLLGGEGIVKPVTDLLSKKAEIKAEAEKGKREIESALQTKKLEQIAKSDDYEQAWNLAQINNAGWKDEFWTIVLSLPFIGCFFPFFQPWAWATGGANNEANSRTAMAAGQAPGPRRSR